MTSVGLVILIDDSEEDNFIHQYLLKRENLASQVRCFVYALDALSFLRSPGRPPVDLILIDINMPRMNGFEFADEYVALYPELKANTKLVMVSASLSPDDVRRAEEHAAIEGFIRKPIKIEVLRELLGRIPVTGRQIPDDTAL